MIPFITLLYIAVTIPFCLFVKDGGDWWDVALAAIWPIVLVIVACMIFTRDQVIDEEEERRKSCLRE